MKHKHVITVVAIVILLYSIAAVIGCAGSNKRMLVDMMRKMPMSTSSFRFMDIQALRGDDDLKDLYKGWRDSCEYTLDDYGIVPNDVNCTAISFNEGCYLIDGDFDIGKLRNMRDSLGFNEHKYRDVEVWERTGEAVALIEHLIITGTDECVRDCIDVIKGDKDSFWDNQDVRDLVDRLPDGIMMYYELKPTWVINEGLEAQGSSIEKGDEDTVNVTWIYMFEDEDAARDAIDQISENIERKDYKYSDVSHDKKFVIVIFEQGIEQML